MQADKECALQNVMALSGCPALKFARLDHNVLTSVAGLEGEGVRSL